jgi:hypothetical protein
VSNSRGHCANGESHGEHDFASFLIAGDTLFCKIDCYDAAFEF